MFEFRYAPAFRMFSLFGALFLLGLSALGLLVLVSENDPVGGLLGLALLPFVAGWLTALLFSPVTVALADNQLTIRRWVGVHRLATRDITAIRTTPVTLILATPTGDLHLAKLYANADAELLDLLETHLPAGQQRRAQRLTAGLPLVVPGKPSTALVTTGIGLLLLLSGIVALVYPLLNFNDLVPFQRIAMPLFGLFSGSFGLLFLYMVLFTYHHRTVFTATAITFRAPLRTTTQPLAKLVAIDPGHTITDVRGIPRRVYHISFHFTTGDTFIWKPNAFAFPMDYIDAAEAAHVRDLTEQLRRAYLGHA